MQNDPTPHTEWSIKNVVNALVVAALSAGVLSCQLYASDYPKETAIAALFLVVFASIMRLPISAVGAPPVVNIESAPNMTQNVAAPPADPAPDPPPPIGHRTVYVPTRDAKGHYAKSPPLDIHADH